VERFLALIQRYPRWSWAGLMVYAAAVTFPHEQVQAVVGSFATLITHRRLYQLSAALAVLLGILLTWVLLRRIAQRADRRTLVGFWILSIVLVVGAWRLLTANNTELVHYPQYVPEGMTLIALTLSPAESMAWVAIFGGLDETYQYAYLTGGRPVPLDFNDIYMDLLGGAIGILLGIAFLPAKGVQSSWRRILRRPGVVAFLGILAAGVVLWALGFMRLHDDKANPRYWFSLSHSDPSMPWLFHRIWGPHMFHELLPVEGPLWILATIAIYALLDRRLAIGLVTEPERDSK